MRSSQPNQHLLGLFLQHPEIFQQLISRLWRLVFIKILIGQNFITQLRTVLLADNGFSDLTFEELLNILAVLNIFIVRNILTVGKLGRNLESFNKGIDRFVLFFGGLKVFCQMGNLFGKGCLHLFFKYFHETIFRAEGEANLPFNCIELQTNAEINIALVKLLLFLEVGRGKGPGIQLGEVSRLVVFIGLPEDHAYLVVSKIRVSENFHMVILAIIRLVAAVQFFNPLPVPIQNTVSLVAK